MIHDINSRSVMVGFKGTETTYPLPTLKEVPKVSQEVTPEVEMLEGD